jgi:diaminobutyrate--2-oxoglutarate aminotransferase
VKGREAIVSFTNAFHGMSLGSLAVTGNAFKRAGAGVPLVHGTPMPFDNYFDGQVPDFLWFERLLEDQGSGLNKPAAVIVETVQGEGGINVARPEWLRALAELCERQDMLLIVDDIQMGCGRTGAFFSFEEAGITPDIVTVSKSISGYGLPMSLCLFKPELDVWEPGEHNGTFRGNNPAFVTATAALETYWADGSAMEKQTRGRGEQIEQELISITEENLADVKEYRGRGLVWGLEFHEKARAGRVARRAFELGLLIETSGPEGEVVKLLPALTVTPEELDEGSQHRDRPFVQGHRRHRPACEVGVRHLGEQAHRPRQGEGRLLPARDDPVRGHGDVDVVREPHRGRRLRGGRGRTHRPRDRAGAHHHARDHVPPRWARAAHAPRQGGLPLHLRVQPARHGTGGPRRERRLSAAHRARGGVTSP